MNWQSQYIHGLFYCHLDAGRVLNGHQKSRLLLRPVDPVTAFVVAPPPPTELTDHITVNCNGRILQSHSGPLVVVPSGCGGGRPQEHELNAAIEVSLRNPKSNNKQEGSYNVFAENLDWLLPALFDGSQSTAGLQNLKSRSQSLLQMLLVLLWERAGICLRKSISLAKNKPLNALNLNIVIAPPAVRLLLLLLFVHVRQSPGLRWVCYVFWLRWANLNGPIFNSIQVTICGRLFMKMSR